MGLVSEYFDRFVIREVVFSFIVILFCLFEIFFEFEINVDEFFDKCGNFQGVIIDCCSVLDCRGLDVNCEDFLRLWEELVDFKDVVFCVLLVVIVIDVQYVKLIWFIEVFFDFFMLVIKCVEEIVFNIFVEV